MYSLSLHKLYPVDLEDIYLVRSMHLYGSVCSFIDLEKKQELGGTINLP